MKWLEDSLSTSKARWKIVVMHHPLYSSGKKHGSNGRLQMLLEPLFVRYGVAAVFAGHDHVYGRMALIKGVQYFVSGAAASASGAVCSSRATTSSTASCTSS